MDLELLVSLPFLLLDSSLLLPAEEPECAFRLILLPVKLLLGLFYLVNEFSLSCGVIFLDLGL
jgi:hypothetical protein